jgi:uncharacterized damage-inducible protein DinB
MPANLSLNDLLEYTDWERQKWHGWLRQHGDHVLRISAGPHGDGRFETVGDLVRHIFSAEKRYIDRLSNRPITDVASIPNGSVEALFEFGQQSRNDLREFMEKFPAPDWEVSQDFHLMNNVLTATPRKIVVHVLIHEIRHWAQIGTLFRLNGFPGEFHDFLFSPVRGGELRREPGKA